MTEVWFYHLNYRPLERVLPALLERTLARKWRAVVQAGTDERVAALDTLLWTYDGNSFLAHGTPRDPHHEHQPVFLTSGEENPNGAAVRFLVDGAWSTDIDGYDRVVVMFDGADPERLGDARKRWKEAKAAGHAISYWQETESGKWEKKA